MNSSNLAASLSPTKEWNHSHHHLSACFSMKFSMIFLGKVICSQSGLVHLVICRLKGLCRLTSKIAIAIACLGTRHFTNSFRCLHHFHPLSIPLLRSNPSKHLHRKFCKKSSPRRQAFFSLRFRSCSHWRIPLTWVDGKIAVVRTMWRYFKSTLHSQTRKRASQFWSKATWLQKWTTPTSVAKLVQV